MPQLYVKVAACQPPALAAVISLYSTDNRYEDDIHYKVQESHLNLTRFLKRSKYVIRIWYDSQIRYRNMFRRILTKRYTFMLSMFLFSFYCISKVIYLTHKCTMWKWSYLELQYGTKMYSIYKAVVYIGGRWVQIYSTTYLLDNLHRDSTKL